MSFFSFFLWQHSIQRLQGLLTSYEIFNELNLLQIYQISVIVYSMFTLSAQQMANFFTLISSETYTKYTMWASFIIPLQWKHIYFVQQTSLCTTFFGWGLVSLQILNPLKQFIFLDVMGMVLRDKLISHKSLNHSSMYSKEGTKLQFLQAITKYYHKLKNYRVSYFLVMR